MNAPIIPIRASRPALSPAPRILPDTTDKTLEERAFARLMAGVAAFQTSRPYEIVRPPGRLRPPSGRHCSAEGAGMTAAGKIAEAPLPCPFCGGEAVVMEGEECAWVQCLDMKMHRAMFVDGDNNAAAEALEQWNRRADLADAQAEKATRDIDILLAQIDWLETCLGGSLDDDDAALVHQIREDWIKPRAVPSPSQQSTP